MRSIGVWGICGHMYRLLQETHTSLSVCLRGGRTYYRPANDPSTADDAQIGPQMIPRLEMIPVNGVAKNREWRSLWIYKYIFFNCTK